MTPRFTISTLPKNDLLSVNELWDSIDFEPTYQRQSDVWGLGKRQLFIDSLINGFDIPKLYFHQLSYDTAKPSKKYAIIDGKQRLEAIHHFLAGEFDLSEEFEYLHGDGVSNEAAGLGYRELAVRYPVLKTRLDRAELPVVVVQTTDPELIDEMFSRLNEAVPLNAPEKRNALGGPLPREIRRVVQNIFFTSRMGFPNSRYRHLDLATKFLYIEHRNGLVDLKKKDLDDFVKVFKAEKRLREANALYTKCASTLNCMEAVFVPSDPLLTSVGMITIYYQLMREAAAENWLGEVEREKLLRFDDERAQNRGLVREVQELSLSGRGGTLPRNVDPVLTQFERYAQSPNDATALINRLAVLRQFVRPGGLPADPI